MLIGDKVISQPYTSFMPEKKEKTKPKQNHATPNPRAFSRALFNFSSKTLWHEYSGKSSRPKQVRLVGRRCYELAMHKVLKIFMNAMDLDAYCIPNTVLLNDKHDTRNAINRNSVTGSDKLQKLRLLLSRKSPGNAPEVSNNGVARSKSTLVAGMPLQLVHVDLLDSLNDRLQCLWCKNRQSRSVQTGVEPSCKCLILRPNRLVRQPEDVVLDELMPIPVRHQRRFFRGWCYGLDRYRTVHGLGKIAMRGLAGHEIGRFRGHG